MKTLFTLLFLLPLASFTQLIPEGDPSLVWRDVDHEWYNKQRILDNDKNGDGMLSRDEVLSGDITLIYLLDSGRYKDVDRNGDRRISNEELRTFNQHEKRWQIERQYRLLDSLKLKYPGIQKPTAEFVTSNPEAFQKALSNPYWMDHNGEFAKKYYTDAAWLTAHPRETKALLGNRMWLAQNPLIAKNLYTVTELTWKKDMVMSRWIRKHQQYIAEYK